MSQSLKKHLFRYIWQFGVVAAISFSLVESMLRFFPAVIPMGLLIEFSQDARTQVATTRKLPTAGIMQFAPRDDGGPPLRIPKPNTEINQEFRDIGAVNPQRSDSQGFCNSPAGLSSDNQYDILGLGDSFTWCTAVLPEDAWPKVLGKKTGLTSYNLGAPANGLYEYVQILKWFGLSKRPKFVVVNVYEGNDFRDALIYLYYKKTRSPTSQKNNANAEGSSGLGFLERSYTANLIRAFIRRYFLGSSGNFLLQDRSFKPSIKILLDVFKTRFHHPDFRYDLVFPNMTVAFNVDNADRDEPMVARGIWEGKIGFQGFDGALKALVELGRRNKFRLIITYTPTANTAYRKYVTFRDPRLKEFMPFFSEAQRFYFKHRAKKFGYLFVDLTKVFQKEAERLQERELLYFPGNLHLTKTGHVLLDRPLPRKLNACIR